jgi:hypothetical protein
MLHLFVIAAGVMALVHVMAGFQRPRLAVLVSGLLWLLYAVYEHQVATGVICESDCNIRVASFASPTATFASILRSSFPYWHSRPSAPTDPIAAGPARCD